MKPATLKKALKIAYKNEFAKHQEGLTEVEEVLEVAGHLWFLPTSRNGTLNGKNVQ